MKKFSKNSIVLLLFVSFALVALGLTGPIAALSATTPSLGMAATYGVLASTYTNTTAGTTINGDVGFTTGPAVAPLGAHTNYGSGAPYATAGIDQGSALSALASEPCTFTFPPGAINLSTDTTHGTVGIYAPGVYCSSGAMDVGGQLTLNGNGTYIFRPVGALTSTAGAVVTLAGASVCDVFWTPTEATTLAANTTFAGTIIDNAGITVGANTVWTGMALAFGGTVKTDTDTITVPTCTASPALATLHVIKQVINNNGGTASASLFNLHVKHSGIDVIGSPAVGVISPGRSYTLSAGAYVVSEDANISYARSFSGDCDANGNITLASGNNKTCIITNNDIASSSGNGGEYMYDTGLTPDTSGGATPIVKAEWEMNVASTTNGYLGTDDSVNAYSQFMPSGQKDVSKRIAICSIVTDPDGLSDVHDVYADVFYPWDINVNSSAKIDLGPSHIALPDQSNLGCGKLMQEDKMTALSKADGIELFCNKIRTNNNNLPFFNTGYNYDEICKLDGELQKETAAVYCVEKNLSYEDASGVYTVWAVAQDKTGLQGKLANEFVYMPLTAFEADFTSIDYGNVRLNTHKIINGDLTWGGSLATVRNVGNTRAAISVNQNDMGFGKTSGVWNVKYDARIGSGSTWAVYDPTVTTVLDDELDLSELDEIDFSIDVNKFPPDHTGAYTGTMTLTAGAVNHLICSPVTSVKE